jgi:hypothetical protein
MALTEHQKRYQQLRRDKMPPLFRAMHKAELVH